MARYDGIADWYYTEFLGELHDNGRAAALRLLSPGRGRLLLDLGCGTGAHTVTFRDRGWEVIGVDASEDMLRRARGRGLDVGGHPCFVGPHALFRFARGVPELHPGYRPARRYDDAEPRVFNPEGLRARVGASHVPLGEFVSAFTSAGLRVEHLEEGGEDDYPYLVALVARR